jgi:hypothetical protein
MGQYRVEDYDGAVLTLTACDREQAASADGADAADVAFLAMSYFHLGREEDARRELARLREVAKSPRSVAQKYAAYYVDDAVETIEGPPRLDGR